MHRPDFSIIIPVFNGENTIERAIESVINQTYSNWELIIVDDGSTDDLRKNITPYLHESRITYSYQKNKGVAAARNLGIKKSRAKYLIFLDSDDELLPGLLSDLQTSSFSQFDLIFWKALKITEKKSIVWKPVKLEKIYNNLKATFLSGSVCYKKELLLRTGGFDQNLQFGENYELGMRLAQFPNLKTKNLSQVYLKYHLNENFRPSTEPSLKLNSLDHLLIKHECLYKKDSYSYSRLLYQIGYLNEKLGRYGEAIEYYKKAGKIRNLYWKPQIKRILFIFKKLPT
ncbi:glycosyltransferase [Gramella sp. GC03-9]|uniref:Glycosyltransferase n=1 Tax=Christiangramia oceanisediminis TaxID=2920386 RepID=A0A9X2KWS4_9FLAO|nr:glycosyltransferase [Gramella oceanisediminis]MCP9199903.1 glycosyltransferase [Gramella oceanisediminis]